MISVSNLAFATDKPKLFLTGIKYVNRCVYFVVCTVHIWEQNEKGRFFFLCQQTYALTICQQTDSTMPEEILLLTGNKNLMKNSYLASQLSIKKSFHFFFMYIFNLNVLFLNGEFNLNDFYFLKWGIKKL